MADLFGGVVDDFKGFVGSVTELFDRSDEINERNNIPTPVFKPSKEDKTEGSFLSDIKEAALLTLSQGGSTAKATTVDPNLGVLPTSGGIRRSAAAQSQAVPSVDHNRFLTKWTLLARDHARLTKG